MGWTQAICNGTTIHVYEQEGIMNCALACTAMVMRWIQGSRPTSRTLELLSRNAGVGSYKCARVDNKRLKETPLVAILRARAKTEQQRDDIDIGHDAGTSGQNIANMLNLVHIPCTYIDDPTVTQVRGAFKKTKYQHRPVVVGLERACHFVVFLAHKNYWFDSTDYYLADPADGRVHTINLDKTWPDSPRIRRGVYQNDLIDEIVVVN